MEKTNQTIENKKGGQVSRALIGFIVLIGIILSAASYPCVVPQEINNTPIYLQPEIRAGENGKLLDFVGYNSEELFKTNSYYNYSYRGHNYTTGPEIGDFISPHTIQENGEKVDNLFGDPRFLSLIIYATHAQISGEEAESSIKAIKIVCNEEEFFYKVEKVPGSTFSKFFYRADCQIYPGKAVITYTPARRDYALLSAIAIMVCLLICAFIENRLVGRK